MNKRQIEDLIDNKKIEVRTIYHKINGKENNKFVKYRLGIQIKPYVEKHIFDCEKNAKKNYQKNFILMLLMIIV